MTFFIPNISEPKSAEEAYQGVGKVVAKEIGDTITARRIFSLGFAVVLELRHDIVKARGGELNVETQEGEYAEFIIHLPASAKNT